MTKSTKKIIVNGLSSLRVIMALFLPVVFLNVDFKTFIILLVFLFLTDFLDGKLARRWQVQTIGGSLLDPLGDKVLAISCVFALMRWYSNMIFLVILELAICGLNVWRALRCENVKSSFLGKFKTWALSIVLVLGAVSLFWPTVLKNALAVVGAFDNDFLITDEIVNVVLLITIGIEIATFISYLGEFLNEKRRDVQGRRHLKGVKEILKRLFDEEAYIEDKNKSIKEIIMK